MKPPVPPLNLRVATPCRANWDQMEGNERARFCQQCQKHVYNLSSLSSAAAADLIREKEGKLCVRFYQRADGTVLHGEDCPAGLVARQWRYTRKMAGAFASLVLMALGLGKAQAEPPASGKTNQPAASATPYHPSSPIMGKICLPPSTPKPSPSPSPKATR